MTNVKRSKEATGVCNVMGMICCSLSETLGNKGGVAIGFNYFETSFCFVNSHLAAHQAMIKERNDDVKKVGG